MTGTTRSSAGLDERRRRLLWRAWHRGIREMDLILGRFADAELATLTDGEVAELERLMEVPDHDLFAFMTGAKPTPPNYDTPLLARVRRFHAEHPASED